MELVTGQDFRRYCLVHAQGPLQNNGDDDDDKNNNIINHPLLARSRLARHERGARTL